MEKKALVVLKAERYVVAILGKNNQKIKLQLRKLKHEYAKLFIISVTFFNDKCSR